MTIHSPSAYKSSQYTHKFNGLIGHASSV